MPRGSTNPLTVVLSSNPLLAGESVPIPLARVVSGRRRTSRRLLIKIPLFLFFITLNPVPVLYIKRWFCGYINISFQRRQERKRNSQERLRGWFSFSLMYGYFLGKVFQDPVV